MKHFFLVKFFYLFYTPIQRIIVKFEGIRMGKNCSFGGLSYLHKSKGSTMTIGTNCRFMSKTIGNFIGINHQCILTTNNPNSIMTIGNNCGFSGTSIWCFDKITIGNNVRIGANVLIMDGDAHQNDPRAGNNAPIEIQENVWIGANVMVLKGVTIGRNSLIGAGSVVVKDIPANTIAAGNPCKPIRQLSEDTVRKLEEMSK